MALVGWIDTEEAGALWREADGLELEELELILTAAHAACDAWAPEQSTAEVPAHWKLAQIMQAKHLWARFRSGNGEDIGPDGFTISTYPLVLEARQLLRPKRPAVKGLL